MMTTTSNSTSSLFQEHQNRKLDRFWALGEEYIDWLFDAEEFYQISDECEEDLNQ